MIFSSRWLRLCALLFGFAFLYVPIALLVIYSFNASRLVTVWGGFSTRWYGELWHNAQLLESTRTSLLVALVSASLAAVLGSSAAYALSRLGRFRGRTPLSALIYAPLVMPEVITALALLLMFVALGVERGFWTVVIAHTTVGMCFVCVVVMARLADLDRAIEEAAADLGAPPMAVLRQITLPLTAPAIIAGFLMAFTLSLDDFILAQFVSGPGSTTLPMRIYSQVRLGVSPQINAISTLMIAFAGLLMVLAYMIAGSRGANRA
ncbi:MAG: ABC transporter permease [Alphaproteobacteria bacterium]|nr:ABC transporter permease [Alphaproteobacteria bacterium]